ncbi:hypothetical protein C8R44DRAFT_783319 [Mycena epipterygia]|nr:hypothetical protein C8R44DRAFT_783319 [Mycena epipterygia]
MHFAKATLIITLATGILAASAASLTARREACFGRGDMCGFTDSHGDVEEYGTCCYPLRCVADPPRSINGDAACHA